MSLVCKFCGSSELVKFSAQERMFASGEEFLYLECSSCGSIQIKDVPDNLSSYYSGSQYYSFVPLVRSGSLASLLKKIRLTLFLKLKLSKFAPEVYGYWLQKVYTKLDASIADVGCGNGQLLYEMHAGGFKKLVGFDPFLPADVSIADGIELRSTDLASSQEKFDLIMYHHAFEHLVDPEQELITCYDKLNPKGRLLLRLPVADAQVWKDKRELWVQLDAPRHLGIPSVSGLKHLAGKCGFEVEELEFDSTEFQFWGTELYEAGLPLDLHHRERFSDQQILEFKQKALRYNQEGKGDQICMYLQRKD